MKSIKLGLSAAALLLAGYAMSMADSAQPSDTPSRHVVYLHGRIVQGEQSSRPQHPEYGYYEMDKILDTFRGKGFVTSGEIRPKSATVSDSADRVVEQVRQLLESGVPADHVTVVGGSMGGAIALVASSRLQNPEVRFSVMGTCLSSSVQSLVENEGKSPVGYVLAIREASDEVTASCSPWKDNSGSSSPLVAREIVLETGLRHGFLYRPIPAWVDPVVEWASGKSEATS